MKITIITPTYNVKSRLPRTIDSVLSQTALSSSTTRLQYLIVDGGSTDGTVELVRSYADARITLISERDSGVCDAFGKGLTLAEGDICGGINALDYYHPKCFENVIDGFQRRGMKWLHGRHTVYSESGTVISSTLYPKFQRMLIRAGAYGDELPFIQLESTFWARELHRYVDIEALRELKVAGDFFLWYSLARVANLERIDAHLGGWSEHADHVSGDRNQYVHEMRSIAGRKSLAIKAAIRVERMRHRLINRMKNWFGI